MEIIISTALNAVLGQYELFTDRNTRDYRERSPMHEVCIPHRIPCTWEQQGWRNRYKNNSKRVIKNVEEMNVGTKGESPKQGLTINKD